MTLMRGASGSDWPLGWFWAGGLPPNLRPAAAAAAAASAGCAFDGPHNATTHYSPRMHPPHLCRLNAILFAVRQAFLPSDFNQLTHEGGHLWLQKTEESWRHSRQRAANLQERRGCDHCGNALPEPQGRLACPDCKCGRYCSAKCLARAAAGSGGGGFAGSKAGRDEDAPAGHGAVCGFVKRSLQGARVRRAAEWERRAGLVHHLT